MTAAPLLVALFACGPEAGSGRGAPPTKPDGSTAAGITADVTSTESTVTTEERSPSGFVMPPFVARPGSGVGLVRVVELELETAAAVRVTLDDGESARELVFTAVETQWRLPLLGLRPSTAYTVEVATEPPGPTAVLEFETDPLPDGFPIVDVLASDPARAEPGWTLVPARRGDEGTLVVLDEAFEPVWYYQHDDGLTDVRLGPAGALWATGSAKVFRVSLWDGELDSWGPAGETGVAVDVDVLALHHSVVPQADGSFWSLTYESVDVESFPQAYTPFAPMGPETVADVEVVHVSAGGELLERHSLLDLLDPQRLGWDSLDSQRDFGVDWCHGNGLEIDPVRRVALVSMRHQDAVIELDLDTGELNWLLSTPSGWRPPQSDVRLEPRGRTAWPYHMHAPKWTADGSILLFDNRNYVNTPHDGPPELGRASRVVRYAVDPERMEVEETWSYAETLTGTLFVSTMGDVDELPQTGHILANFGNIREEAGVSNQANGWGSASARIIEIDPESPESPVADIRVRSDLSTSSGGWNVYRAERISAGLYPPGMLSD